MNTRVPDERLRGVFNHAGESPTSAVVHLAVLRTAIVADKINHEPTLGNQHLYRRANREAGPIEPATLQAPKLCVAACQRADARHPRAPGS